jgi:hypothetical protein
MLFVKKIEHKDYFDCSIVFAQAAAQSSDSTSLK